LGVPEFLHQFNGKSFVIADSGYVIKDPQGEWLEVGFDVRKFPFLFVDVLYNFRDFIPLAKCHYGFTVQAVEDEDLPEGIICASADAATMLQKMRACQHVAKPTTTIMKWHCVPKEVKFHGKQGDTWSAQGSVQRISPPHSRKTYLHASAGPGEGSWGMHPSQQM
ncbi:unnamed protein product, partial [Symbiodinium necroappetens]